MLFIEPKVTLTILRIYADHICRLFYIVCVHCYTYTGSSFNILQLCNGSPHPRGERKQQHQQQQ
jgi:hypothetical protein